MHKHGSLAWRFQKKYGETTGLIRLAIYPVSLLLTMPIALFVSLKKSCILLDGRWTSFGPQFNAMFSLNNLFYWRLYLELDRRGRMGISPILGGGNFRFTTQFTHCVIALKAFFKSGPVLPLAGMLFWLGMHTLWFQQAPIAWSGSVLLLTAISSLLYSNMFCRQNYHAIAWAFVPLGIYALYTGQTILAAIIWFMISILSLYVLTFSSVICLGIVIDAASPALFLTLIPAWLKAATHFSILLQGQGLRAGFAACARTTGMMTGGARYIMKKETFAELTNEDFLYYLIIWSQFPLALWITDNSTPWLTLTGLFLFLCNAVVIRLHDIQSILMVQLTVGVTSMMLVDNHSLWLLASFWLFISPLPHFLYMIDVIRPLDKVPHAEPFNISPILDSFQTFFSQVNPGQRVFMAFDDPNGNHHALFDGLRYIMEVPLFVTAQKHVSMLPDWHWVATNNSQNAPSYWGRDPETVISNAHHIKAQYVIIYQKDGNDLNDEWEKRGCRVLSSYAWHDHVDYFRHEAPFTSIFPLTWWLLELPHKENE